MALKAGYYGVKKKDQLKLEKLPAFEEIGTGLQVTDDGELEATGATLTIEANPEGVASETLTKLQLGENIYSIPGNDNSKCYQTDDATESSIVDADYIPFLDSSAASGAGAPGKTTWSNFKSKIKAFLDPNYVPMVDTSVSSSDDLDNITDTGIYKISSAPTHAPEGISYCGMIVQKNSDTNVRQIVFTGSVIYIRSGGQSPLVWTAWTKITGTLLT